MTMLTASDMPSWMLVLSGIIPSRGELNEKARMVLRGQYMYSLEDLQRVHAVNPMREMEKVETPICFVLGGRDCRVVNQQTLEAYRLLKSFGKDVEWGRNWYLTVES